MNFNNLSAVIPMGGQGTRLKEITGDTPKALYPIYGKNTIERCCEELIKNGISKIIITLAYKNQICYEIIKIRSKKTNFFLEFDKMWIHGYLHLIGYDHKRLDDYNKMLRKEKLILKYFHKVN